MSTLSKQFKRSTRLLPPSLSETSNFSGRRLAPIVVRTTMLARAERRIASLPGTGNPFSLGRLMPASTSSTWAAAPDRTASSPPDGWSDGTLWSRITPDGGESSRRRERGKLDNVEFGRVAESLPVGEVAMSYLERACSISFLTSSPAPGDARVLKPHGRLQSRHLVQEKRPEKGKQNQFLEG